MTSRTSKALTELNNSFMLANQCLMDIAEGLENLGLDKPAQTIFSCLDDLGDKITTVKEAHSLEIADMVTNCDQASLNNLKSTFAGIQIVQNKKE